ncbi:MAG: hypothetical protein PHS17_11835 [Desulfobacterales bacterium]|nr:hypothetical protein [Desulfobacterales bacterium]
MKLCKTWLFMMVAVLCLCLAPGTAPAADRAQVLKQGAEKLKALFGESEGKALMQNVDLFKQAGLSYQPSLVLPVEGLIGCKDKEQLRILLGMYAFDANYALLFGKKQEFGAANTLVVKSIPERLNMGSKLKFKSFTQDELKKIADNPNDPANRDLYIKYVIANFHDLFQAAESDQEIMATMVDALYGSIVQCLYVSSRLALAAGTGEKLVDLFNDQAKRLDKFQQVLEAYAGDPELAGLVERPERQPVIRPVFELLKAKKGNLSEAYVKKILSSIEPERGKVAEKCD